MRVSLTAIFGVLLSTSTAFADTASKPQWPRPCIEGSARDASVRKSSDLPWGVAVAGAFSKQGALDEFESVKERYADILHGYAPILVPVCDLSMGARLRYSARVGMNDRDAADLVCTKLQAQGGACIVLRN